MHVLSVAFLAQDFVLVTDSMAAVRRYPLRIYENVDAAYSRVRAGMLSGGVDVSTVTKVWPAAAGSAAPVTVVSFVLRGVPSRRERRQKRSEARSAAFRARRSGELAVEEAGAVGAEYARELLAFSGLSAEAAPFAPLPESAEEVLGAAEALANSLNRRMKSWELRKHPPIAESTDEVLGAAAALAERIIVRGEDARGIALPIDQWSPLCTSLPPDALSGLNAAVSLQRWWRARRTERDAARDEDAPVAQADAVVPPAAAADADLSRDAALLVERDAARDEDAPVALADAAVPPAAAAAADLSRDAALLLAGQGAALLQADTTSEMLQGPPEFRRDADERLRGRPVPKWGVLHGLTKQPHHNGKLVIIGKQRGNGRFETVRPGSRPDGSREELAARPENLRLLLAEYQGITAGDEVDFVGGVLELLGFDPETACWAGKQEISSGQYQYVWVPERNFSQFMLS